MNSFSRFSAKLPVKKEKIKVIEPVNLSTKEEIDQRIFYLRQQIFELEKDNTQLGGKYLGWGEEEHKEFLVVINRWNLHLQASLNDSNENTQINFFKKFFPKLSEKEIKKHYDKTLKLKEIEIKKKHLLSEFKTLKRKQNIFNLQEIQKENQHIENFQKSKFVTRTRKNKIEEKSNKSTRKK